MTARSSPLPCLIACAIGACSAASAPGTRAAPLKLEPETCPLSAAIDRELSWSPYVVDCGSLRRGEPASEWQRARDCLLTAQQAGIAYKLSYPLASYDSLDSAAIATRGGAQPAFMWQRSSTPSAPWRMRTSLHVTTCSDIDASPDCTVGDGQLCLVCVGERAARTLCEETSALPK